MIRLANIEPPNSVRVRFAHSHHTFGESICTANQDHFATYHAQNAPKASLLAIATKSLSRASRMRNHGDPSDARKLSHSIRRPNICLQQLGAVETRTEHCLLQPCRFLSHLEKLAPRANPCATLIKRPCIIMYSKIYTCASHICTRARGRSQSKDSVGPAP